MIDRLWAARMIVADHLVATGHAPRLRLAGTIEKQRRWLRAAAKSLASRDGSGAEHARRPSATTPQRATKRFEASF